MYAIRSYYVQGAFAHIAIEEGGLLAIDGGQLHPLAGGGTLAQLHGGAQGQIAQFHQLILFQSLGAAGQKGVTYDADRQARIQSLGIEPGCQLGKQLG